MIIKKKVFLVGIFVILFIKVQIASQPIDTNTIVYISDENFKTCLLENPNINTNNDTEIQLAEAQSYHGDTCRWSTGIVDIYKKLEIVPPKLLDVSNKNISDLTGIEAFTSLEGLSCNNNNLNNLHISTIKTLLNLDCSNNHLQELSLTFNNSLLFIACSNNELSNLDVQNNKILQVLTCSDNHLSNLTVSGNTKLHTLYCDANKLTTLTVTDAPKLEVLYCNDNFLLDLDITTNTNLQLLECSNNRLTSIDLTNNSLLLRVFCNHNQLQELVVNKNLALIQLACNGNQLKELNVKNNSALKELYCGVNHLHFLNLEACPDISVLECRYNDSLLLFITDIQYYNYAEAGSWYFDDAVPLVAKKATTSIVTIPDRIFKTYLLNNPTINLNQDSEIQIFEAEAYLGDEYEWDQSAKRLYTSLNIHRPMILNIANIGIKDLTGIEKFTNLQGLICVNNKLSKLDVSTNKKLQFLYCFDNNLSELNLDSNPSLSVLLCGNNNLKKLDISSSKGLRVLNCSENQFTELDIKRCPTLAIMNCNQNSPYILHVTEDQKDTYSDTKIWTINNAQLAY